MEIVATSAAESTYEVFAVRYATRLTHKSELFLNHHLYGESDDQVRMDYFFWVARNSTRTIVIDCGYGAEVGARRGRSMLIAPRSALALLGIDAATVSQLILTHGHYDHIGNIAAFPAAELVISRKELDFWLGPYGQRIQLGAHTEPSEIEQISIAARNDRVTFVDGQYSPAPGIEIIEVGGHTAGQTIVLVPTPSGQVVLASDSVHLFEEYERDRPFAIVTDLPGMYRTYELLREITAAPGSALVAGHDPDVMTRFTHCEGDLNGIAVRIG